MKKFLLGTLMTLISLGGSIAQDNPDLKKPGYEITMKSNGVKQGDKIRLAVYTGEYSNFADSTYVGPNNTFVFKGAKRFTGGFYYVVLPSQKFFEVVIDQDQHFAVEADTADLTKIKFTGSPDNENYQKYVSDVNEIAFAWQDKKVLRDAETEGSAKYLKIDEEMKAMSQKSRDIKAKFLVDNDKGLYALFLKAKEPVVPPEAPESIADPSEKNLWRFYYYKNHFWDNFDLTDDRILHTNAFHEKLNEYLILRTDQKVDSITKYADIIVGKVKPNKEMYKYVVNFITNYYYQPKIMCLESVFVDMVDRYLTDELCWWFNTEELYRVREKANGMRYSLCGSPGQALLAPDVNGEIKSMNDLKSPLLLVFLYSASCDHCQKAAPKVINLYNKYHNEMGVLDVYSLCTDTKDDKFSWFQSNFKLPWKYNVIDTQQKSKFYKYYHIGVALPELYVLGPDRKILFKKLTPEQLGLEIEKWLLEHPEYKKN